MNDRRSRIRYSVCSSERLWSDCSTTILNFKIASYGLRPALLLRSSGFVSVTLSMSARKSSHRTIFLIVSSGSPLALIASSLRSISKKPVCPMTRSFHPPMVHCNQRVRFAATWREEFFEVPFGFSAIPVYLGAPDMLPSPHYVTHAALPLPCSPCQSYVDELQSCSSNLGL